MTNFNPYCPICSACGYEGCCPPTMCTFEEGCDNKDIYLKDLRFGYVMYEKLKNLLNNLNIEVNTKEIFDKTYEEIYGK